MIRSATTKKVVGAFAAAAISTAAGSVYSTAVVGQTIGGSKVANNGTVRGPFIVRNVGASAASVSDRLAKDFGARLDKFIDRNTVVSSVHSLMLDPLYSELVGFGPDALPWLLGRIDEAPMRIMPILAAISRENPVQDGQRGDVGKMAGAWTQWGRRRGLVS